MMLKAVFFDAAGTLFEPVRRVGESYAAFAAQHGIHVTPAELSQRFRVCFEEAPRLAFPGASGGQLAALERHWWKTVVARVFEPCGPFERFETFFNDLFAYYAAPDAWRLYPEVIDTLEGLKARGVRMSVISNFDSRLLPILAGLGMARFFDQVFVSSRVGYAKPDPRIFHSALRHHGLSANEALHVGDSEINDQRGAARAGLRGILIDRSGRALLTGERIASLARILELIDSPPSSERTHV
jgi:putative hydrolase of the HAD superfamily